MLKSRYSLLPTWDYLCIWYLLKWSEQDSADPWVCPSRCPIAVDVWMENLRCEWYCMCHKLSEQKTSYEFRVLLIPWEAWMESLEGNEWWQGRLHHHKLSDHTALTFLILLVNKLKLLWFKFGKFVTAVCFSWVALGKTCISNFVAFINYGN